MGDNRQQQGGNWTAADDLGGGVKVDRVKMTFGADGTATDVSTANPIPVTQPADQDPIFDHANGTKTSITTSADVIVPPTGCKYIRISSDVDIFVNTANQAAIDNGTSIRILANQPEVIPVTAGVAVKALSSSGTATVRCTPMKAR